LKWIVRAGPSWRMLPHDFPVRSGIPADRKMALRWGVPSHEGIRKAPRMDVRVVFFRDPRVITSVE
jgi:hypothetical protein